MILTSRYQEAVKDYQLIIVQHSRKIQYPLWLHYDTDFLIPGGCQGINRLPTDNSATQQEDTVSFVAAL